MYLWGPPPEALVSSLRQRWSPEEPLAALELWWPEPSLTFTTEWCAAEGLGMKQRCWTPRLV